MLFKDSISLQWTFLKEEITVVSRDPFNITNTTACEQNPCNHVFEQVKLRHQRTVCSTAPTASGQERNNNCRRVRRRPFILPQHWTSQPQFGFSFYSSDSPGLRMSSIFRIILTICVARDICCFLPIRVSMTCCCFISEKHKLVILKQNGRLLSVRGSDSRNHSTSQKLHIWKPRVSFIFSEEYHFITFKDIFKDIPECESGY